MVGSVATYGDTQYDDSLVDFLNHSDVEDNTPMWVALLLDCSYSMSVHSREINRAADGLLETVTKIGIIQKGANFLLAEFSDTYQEAFRVPFSEASTKIPYRFEPQSYTCLYDSIKEIIQSVEIEVAKSNSPNRVVIPILSDGQDSGCGLTASEIKRLIQRKIKEGWQFLFLGAGEETKRIAAKIGISKELAITFDSNKMEQAIKLIGDKIKLFTKGQDLKISHEERLLLTSVSSPEKSKKDEL